MPKFESANWTYRTHPEIQNNILISEFPIEFFLAFFAPLCISRQESKQCLHKPHLLAICPAYWTRHRTMLELKERIRRWRNWWIRKSDTFTELKLTIIRNFKSVPECITTSKMEEWQGVVRGSVAVKFLSHLENLWVLWMIRNPSRFSFSWHETSNSQLWKGSLNSGCFWQYGIILYLR